MKPLDPRPMFVFELANNHMGDLDHGLRIVREVAAAAVPYQHRFSLAVKLQYRDLDTLIHPAFSNRTDLKYIKRFQETRLTENQFRALKDEIGSLGLVSMCTPFDELSVDSVERHGFDVLKVASCSFNDWPLLERVVQTNLPVVASVGGADLQEIDNVVSFFDHRVKPLALMHCVAEYPTLDEHLQLNQLDLFRTRYPHLRVGYSTHERPDQLEAVQVAVAKGATLFEKHVGVPTPEYPLNSYSATPAQIGPWLAAAARAFDMCGVVGSRCQFPAAELANLHSLRRGLYARRRLEPGERIPAASLMLALPAQEAQYTANDLSKYAALESTQVVEAGQPLLRDNVRYVDHRPRVYDILKRVKAVLRESHAAVPAKVDFELSHHHGVERFEEFGAAIINFVNREYCKKLIVLLPGQEHPEQLHKIKEETFQILHGEMDLWLDGTHRRCRAGDLVTVPRETRHRFRSLTGVVIEEISSRHHADDSYYTDPAITRNPARKTLVTYWMD